MKIEIGQIISQIIAFLIMFWILNRFGWKPLLKVMKKRRDLIRGELDFIEKEKEKIAEAKNEYRKKLEDIDGVAAEKIHEAVEKGRQITFAIEQDAHNHAKKIVSKAEEEAQLEVQKAKAQLKHEIVNLTLDATKHLLKQELDAPKQKELILDFVNQGIK